MFTSVCKLFKVTIKVISRYDNKLHLTLTHSKTVWNDISATSVPKYNVLIVYLRWNDLIGRIWLELNN